jgi:hypothetical protein
MRVGPPFLACGDVDRVKMAVATTEVDGAVRDRGGGLNLAEGEEGIAGGLELPLELTAFGIKRVEVAVHAAAVDDALGDGRRGAHPALGPVLPHNIARLGVERIDIAAGTAEVDDPVHPRGGGLEVVPSMPERNGGAGLKPPLLAAGVGIHGEETRVVVDENHAVSDRRRGGNLAAGGEFPFQFASRGVDGVEVARVAAHVNHSLNHCGRGTVDVSRLEPPAFLLNWKHAFGIVDPCMLRVAAEHRGLGIREAVSDAPQQNRNQRGANLGTLHRSPLKQK